LNSNPKAASEFLTAATPIVTRITMAAVREDILQTTATDRMMRDNLLYGDWWRLLRLLRRKWRMKKQSD
jgi:hypothetical protein